MTTSTTRSIRGLRKRIVRRFTDRDAKLGITLGPSAVWLLFFLTAPLLFTIVVSLMPTNESYQIVWSEPGLQNYEDLLGVGSQVPFWETTFVQSFVLSVEIAALTTIVCLLLAFPLAYVLVKLEGITFKLLLALVLLPFFTMYLVRAYSWLLLLGPNGVLNHTLTRLGVIDGPLTFLNFGMSAVVVGLVHAFFPYMLLSLYASLDGVDFTLVEAARDLGASRLQVLKDVILPLTLPGIISGSLFVFVPSLGSFITPRFLGKGKIQMVAMLIEHRINALYAIGYGSAAAMFVILSIAVAFVIAFRYVTIEDLSGGA
jgi:spermidine/putrescine transport system permease protein